jgi:hypothetical protein
MSAGFMGRPEKATKVDPRDRRQLEESPVRPRRVMELFRPHARPLALVTVLIIVTSIVGLAQPFLIKRVIDDALPNRDTDLLVWATVGMVAVAAVSGLLSVVQTWLATSIGQRVMHSLRVAVFAHLQDQSLDFFKPRRLRPSRWFHDRRQPRSDPRHQPCRAHQPSSTSPRRPPSPPPLVRRPRRRPRRHRRRLRPQLPPPPDRSRRRHLPKRRTPRDGVEARGELRSADQPPAPCPLLAGPG